jgi:phosphatidylserine decarboxylase
VKEIVGAIRSVLVPLHPAGWPFVALFAVAAALLMWLWAPLGWLGVVLTAWCAYFFRDPERVSPAGEALVLSPADGRIQSIEQAVPPAELGMGTTPRTRIAVFMNVFDVHVNRIPVDGTVTGLAYRPGRFVNASLDKASEDNERQAVRIATPGGKEIAVVQIAGLVARRILSELYDGQKVRAGDRFGMIRFGSRVDVYLDEGQVPAVLVGQKSVGGETVLATDGGRRAVRREELD